jgi:uncharacterized membrane protein
VTRTERPPSTRSRVLLPAAVLGLGLGAFADGIVLHQVLQWHHLVSAREPSDSVAGLELNTLADGLFHVAAWAVVAGALAWLWTRRGELPGVPGRALVGAALVGWGTFHVVDQVLFHLLLEAHHIRPGEHEQLYDWGYTALGVLMVAAGLALSSRMQEDVASGR